MRFTIGYEASKTVCAPRISFSRAYFKPFEDLRARQRGRHRACALGYGCDPIVFLRDVLGLSGRLMLNALLEGKLSAEEMAQLAKRSARKKIPQLSAALERHRLTDHHRFLLQHALRHLDFLESEVELLNQEIRCRLRTEPFEQAHALLQTTPGIKEESSAAILPCTPSPTALL